MLLANEVVARYLTERGQSRDLPRARAARRSQARAVRRRWRRARRRVRRRRREGPEEAVGALETRRQAPVARRAQHAPAPLDEAGDVRHRERRPLRPRVARVPALHLADPPLPGPRRAPRGARAARQERDRQELERARHPEGKRDRGVRARAPRDGGRARGRRPLPRALHAIAHRRDLRRQGHRARRHPACSCTSTSPFVDVLVQVRRPRRRSLRARRRRPPDGRASLGRQDCARRQDGTRHLGRRDPAAHGLRTPNRRRGSAGDAGPRQRAVRKVASRGATRWARGTRTEGAKAKAAKASGQGEGAKPKGAKPKASQAKGGHGKGSQAKGGKGPSLQASHAGPSKKKGGAKGRKKRGRR